MSARQQAAVRLLGAGPMLRPGTRAGGFGKFEYEFR